eukprot:g2529.t1
MASRSAVHQSPSTCSRSPLNFKDPRPERSIPSRVQLHLCGSTLFPGKFHCHSVASQDVCRRRVLGAGLLISTPIFNSYAKETPVTDLCDDNCVTSLKQSEVITTQSGLQFQDVVIGRGPTTPVGFQAVAHVVTMNQDGVVVDSSLERQQPFDIR